MSNLLKKIFGDYFASPYSRNYMKKVAKYQPVEKVMFVYKLVASVDTNHQLSARDYAESAQKLFGELGIYSSVVSGSLKAHPEKNISGILWP